jgi:hypothetical protein
MELEMYGHVLALYLEVIFCMLSDSTSVCKTKGIINKNWPQMDMSIMARILVTKVYL